MEATSIDCVYCQRRTCNMKLTKTIGLIFGLYFIVCFSTAQTVKELLNTVLTDITEGDCNIELQKNMKPLCLGFDTTQIYYRDVKNIRIHPVLGQWESAQFDNITENNQYNILIKKPGSDCFVNDKIWHCFLSPISFNSDTTIALIQYYKSIVFSPENESGTILYKVRNGKWTRHFVIDQRSAKNSITQ
jgi:hypothetical protein